MSPSFFAWFSLFLIINASTALSTTSSGKENFVCRPDRRGALLEIRIQQVDSKNGPSKASMEIWNDGNRSSQETANILRTELDQKKYIVAATLGAQVSFTLSETPFRGTLNLKGHEDEIDVSCQKN